MARALSPWRRPGGRGLTRTCRAHQSGRRPGAHCSLRAALTGVLGIAAPLRPRPQASPEETPTGGGVSCLQHRSGFLSMKGSFRVKTPGCPGGWCPLPARGAHGPRGHLISAGAPESLGGPAVHCSPSTSSAAGGPAPFGSSLLPVVGP